MSMPFSPCSSSATGECQDTSVNTLKQIFGPIIDKLITGSDPNTVSSTGNIAAAMFSTFNSAVLIVACLIITGALIFGVTNTANDGEAMGKNWSTMWTSTRMVTFGGMLVPTSSGYCYLQTVVLMIALWGIGAANSIYKAGVTIGIVSPNAIVGGINKSGAYYGMRDLAGKYMAVSYCARLANSIYASDGQTPEVKLTKATSNNNDWFFKMVDQNKSTNLSGGLPFCGAIALNSYTASSKTDEAENLLELLHQNLQIEKQSAAITMVHEIDSWVDTWPLSLNSPDWKNVNSTRFNEIVTAAESEIISKSVEKGSEAGSDLNGITERYVETITNKGWADAAGWFQRVGAIRTAISSVTSLPAGQVVLPSYVLLPMDNRTSELSNTVSTVTDTILKKADAHDARKDKAVAPSDIANIIPKSADSIDISALQSDTDDKLNNMTGHIMNALVDTLVDAEGNSTYIGCGTAGQIGGSLNRMKCVGDYLTVIDGSTGTAITLIKSGISALRVTAGAASSVKVMGSGIDADKVTTPLWDWAISTVVDSLVTFKRTISIMALYFSVLLPSMPYGIFMIVVVGYYLAVIQALIAVVLWGVMHMTPERSFIGSQTQGYMLIVGLFVRPSLSVLGLFMSILVSDPVIDYVTTTYFSIQGAVSTSTGVIGSLAQWYTFTWWMGFYAFILLSVLYMIFALPQVLPDHVLKWINVGISDLGETSAAGNMRGRLEQMAISQTPGHGVPVKLGSPGGLQQVNENPGGGRGNDGRDRGGRDSGGRDDRMIELTPGVGWSRNSDNDKEL